MDDDEKYWRKGSGNKGNTEADYYDNDEGGRVIFSLLVSWLSLYFFRRSRWVFYVIIGYIYLNTWSLS